MFINEPNYANSFILSKTNHHTNSQIYIYLKLGLAIYTLVAFYYEIMKYDNKLDQLFKIMNCILLCTTFAFIFLEPRLQNNLVVAEDGDSEFNMVESLLLLLKITVTIMLLITLQPHQMISFSRFPHFYHKFQFQYGLNKANRQKRLTSEPDCFKNSMFKHGLPRYTEDIEFLKKSGKDLGIDAIDFERSETYLFIQKIDEDDNNVWNDWQDSEIERFSPELDEQLALTSNSNSIPKFQRSISVHERKELQYIKQKEDLDRRTFYEYEFIRPKSRFRCILFKIQFFVMVPLLIISASLHFVQQDIDQSVKMISNFFPVRLKDMAMISEYKERAFFTLLVQSNLLCVINTIYLIPDAFYFDRL